MRDRGRNERLRDARIAAGYTQTRLARAVGLKENGVWFYESRGKVPDIERAAAIAGLLGKEVEDIFPAERYTVYGRRRNGPRKKFKSNAKRGKLNYALRNARIRANLTLEELASKSRLSLIILCNYETGTRKPGYEVAEQLAGILGEEAGVLFPEVKIPGRFEAENLGLKTNIADKRTPDCELERKELRGIIAEALGRLPAGYKEACYSCFAYGKSTAECAWELGKSREDIRKKLKIAVEKLQHLAKYAEGRA